MAVFSYSLDMLQLYSVDNSKYHFSACTLQLLQLNSVHTVKNCWIEHQSRFFCTSPDRKKETPLVFSLPLTSVWKPITQCCFQIEDTFLLRNINVSTLWLIKDMLNWLQSVEGVCPRDSYGAITANQIFWSSWSNHCHHIELI